ncbi:MAG: squalene/phytoene synthase family protein [Verrucomicrobiota bacterium]
MSEAKDITKKAKSNLAFALVSLPKENQDDVTTFYAFCRKIDDLADDPDLPLEDKKSGLADWSQVFTNPNRQNSPLEQEVRQLRDKHNIPNEHFLHLIEGCQMDLQPQRFGTWEDLQTYTHRVASTVGLICLPLFGARDCRSIEYAEHLGHALQLTNIMRDVGEDLDNGTRIYLPLADLARFQYTERDLLGRVHDDRFVALMNFQADRANELYAKAMKALPHSDRKALLAAEIMRALYQRLLHKMQRDKFHVFHQRYRISRARKLLTLVRLSLRARLG